MSATQAGQCKSKGNHGSRTLHDSTPWANLLISQRKPIHKISMTEIISRDPGHRETDLILHGLEKFLNDNRKPASWWDGLHTASV